MERVRTVVTRVADLVRNPTSSPRYFHETENQRIKRMERVLVATGVVELMNNALAEYKRSEQSPVGYVSKGLNWNSVYFVYAWNGVRYDDHSVSLKETPSHISGTYKAIRLQADLTKRKAQPQLLVHQQNGLERGEFVSVEDLYSEEFPDQQNVTYEDLFVFAQSKADISYDGNNPYYNMDDWW
jgi:hypothetical protein